MTDPQASRTPQSDRRSFVVTGVGLVSAAGDTSEALYDAFRSGDPLGDWETGPASTGIVRVAAIDGFDPKAYLKRKGLRDLSRTSLLACCSASRLAPALAGVDASRIGVAFGTAWGSLRTVIDFERAAHRDGPRFVDPLLFTETVSNVPAGQVAIVLGWSAFNVTVSAGSASALEAIRTAIDLLGDGRAEIAVAGGGDEINLPILRCLAAEDRAPLFGGEGACWLAIEREDRAISRGASRLARVLAIAGGSGDDGRGANGRKRAGDARERNTPREERMDGRGLHARADRIAGMIRSLLDDGGVSPSAVDLVVLSTSAVGDLVVGGEEGPRGTSAGGSDRSAAPARTAPLDFQSSSALRRRFVSSSALRRRFASSGALRRTEANLAEIAAVASVFGGEGHGVPTVAPKTILGETWGAAGALGAAVAIEAIRSGRVEDPARARDTAPRPVRVALVLDSTSRGGHLFGLLLGGASEADHRAAD